MERKAPSVLGQTQGLHFLSLTSKQNWREHWKTQEPTLLNTVLPETREAKLREQHNPNKKPSLHQPRKTRPWQLCRYSKIPGGRSIGWKKTPTAAKLLPSTARGRQMWGKLRATQFMRYSAPTPLKLHGKILSEQKHKLGSKPLCDFGHPHSPPIPC